MHKMFYWFESAKKKEYVLFLLLFVFSLPFENSYSNIIIALYILYTGVFFLRQKALYSFDRSSWFTIQYLPLLFIMLVISLVYSEDFFTGLSVIWKFIYLLVVPLLFCFFCLNAREKRLILVSFLFANVGAILFNLGRATSRSLHFTNGDIKFDASVLGGQAFWYSIVQGGNYFFYEELSYFLHPTYWAIYLLFCVFIILDTFTQKVSFKLSIFYGCLLVVFLMVIFLCSSRIVIVSATFLLSIYFVNIMLRKRSLYWVIPGAILLLIVSITFVKNPRFVGFGSFSSLETVHHMRLENWRSAIAVFKENPFFGVGIGDSKNRLMDSHLTRGYQEGYQRQYNEHNQYLQIANSCGLVGLGIFLLSIGVGFRKSFSHKDYLQFAYIFSFALVCVVENFLVRRAGVVYFALFYCLLFTPTREVDK